jgi:hypothetical protein
LLPKGTFESGEANTTLLIWWKLLSVNFGVKRLYS